MHFCCSPGGCFPSRALWPWPDVFDRLNLFLLQAPGAWLGGVHRLTGAYSMKIKNPKMPFTNTHFWPINQYHRTARVVWLAGLVIGPSKLAV